MTALDTLYRELANLQRQANECITDYGHVKSDCREEYMTLVTQITVIRNAVIVLENLKAEKEKLNQERKFKIVKRWEG